RTRETARIASGRPDQRAVGHGLPARERDGLGGRIDLGDRAAEQQLDPALGPELRRPDQDALERFLAGEVFLRQRRALVGRLAVATDHPHRTLEPLLAERDRRLRAAVPRADDDDIRAADHSPAPAVSAAAGCAPGWRSAPAWRARAARRLARGRSWCGTGRSRWRGAWPIPRFARAGSPCRACPSPARAGTRSAFAGSRARPRPRAGAATGPTGP